MKKDLSARHASLYQFWERIKTNKPVSQGEWNEQVYYLSQSGIGTEEALKFIYTKQPSYEAFLDWQEQTYQSGRSATHMLEGDMLTKDDLAFWEQNGYLVIPNAVSDEECAAARAAIWQYLDANAETPESWYQQNAGKNGMMLSLFQHPALDSNRHSPKIRKVYEELYNGTDIYLLVDKVSFNPPETLTSTFIGSALHWDVSLHLPIPFVLQGLLYLNDVTAEDGAFHCVPGFHKQIDSWIAGLPENTDPRGAAVQELNPIPVPGNAGDLVIWHQALPHCATPNKGKVPRMVQYIAYKPVKVEEAALWK